MSDDARGAHSSELRGSGGVPGGVGDGLLNDADAIVRADSHEPSNNNVILEGGSIFARQRKKETWPRATDRSQGRGEQNAQGKDRQTSEP